MCLGNLLPSASRMSASLCPTRLLATANPGKSGTVSRSQTMTLGFICTQPLSHQSLAGEFAKSAADHRHYIICAFEKPDYSRCLIGLKAVSNPLHPHLRQSGSRHLQQIRIQTTPLVVLQGMRTTRQPHYFKSIFKNFSHIPFPLL